MRWINFSSSADLWKHQEEEPLSFNNIRNKQMILFTISHISCFRFCISTTFRFYLILVVTYYPFDYPFIPLSLRLMMIKNPIFIRWRNKCQNLFFVGWKRNKFHFINDHFRSRNFREIVQI